MTEIPTKKALRAAIVTLHDQPDVANLLWDILQGRWTLVDEHATVHIRPVFPADIMLASQVRRMCGIAEGSRHTLIRWRRDRGFPEPIRSIKVGKGRKAQTVDIYDRRQVRQWLKDNPPVQ